jgi:hypothetical protein
LGIASAGAGPARSRVHLRKTPPRKTGDPHHRHYLRVLGTTAASAPARPFFSTPRQPPCVVDGVRPRIRCSGAAGSWGRNSSRLPRVPPCWSAPQRVSPMDAAGAPAMVAAALILLAVMGSLMHRKSRRVAVACGVCVSIALVGAGWVLLCSAVEAVEEELPTLIEDVVGGRIEGLSLSVSLHPMPPALVLDAAWDAVTSTSGSAAPRRRRRGVSMLDARALASFVRGTSLRIAFDTVRQWLGDALRTLPSHGLVLSTVAGGGRAWARVATGGVEEFHLTVNSVETRLAVPPSALYMAGIDDVRAYVGAEVTCKMPRIRLESEWPSNGYGIPPADLHVSALRCESEAGASLEAKNLRWFHFAEGMRGLKVEVGLDYAAAVVPHTHVYEVNRGYPGYKPDIIRYHGNLTCDLAMGDRNWTSNTTFHSDGRLRCTVVYPPHAPTMGVPLHNVAADIRYAGAGDRGRALPDDSALRVMYAHNEKTNPTRFGCNATVVVIAARASVPDLDAPVADPAAADVMPYLRVHVRPQCYEKEGSGVIDFGAGHHHDAVNNVTGIYAWGATRGVPSLMDIDTNVESVDAAGWWFVDSAPRKVPPIKCRVRLTGYPEEFVGSAVSNQLRWPLCVCLAEPRDGPPLTVDVSRFFAAVDEAKLQAVGRPSVQIPVTRSACQVGTGDVDARNAGGTGNDDANSSSEVAVDAGGGVAG